MTCSTSDVARCCSRASASSRVRAPSCFFNSISELGPLLMWALAFVPVERSLRPRVGLFAPLRPKVTSSAQSLGLPILTHDELASSLDHLVGSHEHARRHGQAERPGGLKVDDRFILSRCLHWKVGGLNTTQDTVDIGCSLPKLIDAVGAVAQETTGHDEETVRIDCRQAMPGRE